MRCINTLISLKSNMDLDLSKSLKNPVYIFNISNIGPEEIYSLSTATFPSLYKNASVALTQD